MMMLLPALFSTGLAAAQDCESPRMGEAVKAPTEQMAISLTKAFFDKSAHLKKSGTPEVQRYEPCHATLTSGV
jgi:hypothetical protein